MNINSCRVRASDFSTPWFWQRADELGHKVVFHRKIWEQCVITQVYRNIVFSNGIVLGFGVGREPLAAWFAKRGALVTATDSPNTNPAWTDTGQHATSIDDVGCSGFKGVTFRPVDMNNIPEDLHGRFDFTWSSGSFEHLGSIEAGLSFFCNQMKCLKRGGIAVHTTEFNPIFGDTLETKDLVLFRLRDIIELGERLMKQGDNLWPFDPSPGLYPEDLHVDKEPWGLPHLSIKVGDFTTTSIVLIARRG